MNGLSISIIKETKDFITIKMPRRFASQAGLIAPKLTETEALHILREGMREYKIGVTKSLTSLKTLRNGHRV